MGSSYSALATTDDSDVIFSRDSVSTNTNTPSIVRPVIRPAVHLDAINSLAVVRAGMIISCSSDKTIALNNMDTGACIMRWRGHDREVTKAIYKHVGRKHFVLSGSKDHSIRLWYFQSPNFGKKFNGHDMAVTALASLEEAKFVSGSRDGCLNIWDMNTDRPFRNISNRRNMITHIEYEPQTQLLCQTSEDGCLRLWDRRNLSLICEFPFKAHALVHCSICSSSMTCATSSAGSYDYGNEVSLWDLRERKLIKDFHGHEGNVRGSVFLHPQAEFTWKRYLLSVSDDHTARIWNINTGACVWTETIPATLNACVAFPDGSVVIAGGNATLCDMRMQYRAGRPYLQCNTMQSNAIET